MFHDLRCRLRLAFFRGFARLTLKRIHSVLFEWIESTEERERFLGLFERTDRLAMHKFAEEVRLAFGDRLTLREDKTLRAIEHGEAEKRPN